MPDFCSQCQGKNIQYEDKIETVGNTRYVTRTIFCGDCRFILQTKHWTEEVHYPKENDTEEEDW